MTKKYYPNCTYHGVDIVDDYYNDDNDRKSMDKLFLMDLTELKFDQLNDNAYDVIIMSHIIEHLHNGDKVIEGILSKLKPNGLLYVEYPSVKSVNLPSMRETLNFFDDPTHCRLYDVKEIYNLMMKNKFSMFRCEIFKRSFILFDQF
ncbi:MAG: class I SAM-dependent methyltransferase [Bacteroidales bacterium]|nr:class I SAM-dependent methyltransferase [Bacteroidales bacterium]